MAEIADFDVLVLPGWQGAGPDHWQTHWQRAFANFRRVEQADWDRPVYAAWAARLSEEVARCARPALLIAHSLGTSLIMRWSQEGETRKVAGAFMVAPSDRDRFDGAPDAPVQGFAPMLLKPIPFPSMVLASRNDDRVAFDRAQLFARAWGSRLVDVGERGHIGSVANLGLWPQGLVHLGQFVESLRPRGRD
ncbi:MAG: alpha/beta hydrolase [Alphaproteobacteria bacterium]|nr:alpha/beta hydrolase [Alphaproteobacteria bacterium]